MMSSNTKGGKVYENAMCISMELLSEERARNELDGAISILKELPGNEPVVIFEGETLINVEEAIKHLETRKEHITSLRRSRRA